jgi:hypothetical protein
MIRLKELCPSIRPLWLALPFLAWAGCAKSPTAMNACPKLSVQDCARDGRCTVVASCCGAAARCAPGGVSYVCPVTCTPPCSALSEGPCAGRADCIADRCEDRCSCGPRFVGCRAATAPPLGCTPATCAQPASCCRSSSDCTQPFQQCFAPGEEFGCGACVHADPPCQTDAECAAMPYFICAAPLCSCAGEKSCIIGCRDDADCGLGQSCGPDHRCRPRACGAQSACPENFDCTGGTCVRRSCVGDAACQGDCVNGRCYPTVGSCSAPPG